MLNHSVVKGKTGGEHTHRGEKEATSSLICGGWKSNPLPLNEDDYVK
jgi:hypothetical protein